MDVTLDAYTDLEAKVKSVPIEASKGTLETFRELIEESNELAKRVKATDEVIKDAYVVSALASSLHESTKCINISESTFDPEIFARAIINQFSRSHIDEDSNIVDLNWDALGEKVKPLFRYAPGLTYIAGSKNDQASTQVQKILEKKPRQAKKPLEEKKEPEKVKTITKTDVGVTATENIYELLRRYYRRNENNPVCFFSFIIDPKSFSKTVENIFHLSFLARDGHVVVSLDNRKLPVLTPVPHDKTAKNKGNAAHKDKVQALISIDYSQWKAIIQEFNITNAVIP